MPTCSFPVCAERLVHITQVAELTRSAELIEQYTRAWTASYFDSVDIKLVFVQELPEMGGNFPAGTRQPVMGDE